MSEVFNHEGMKVPSDTNKEPDVKIPVEYEDEFEGVAVEAEVAPESESVELDSAEAVDACVESDDNTSDNDAHQMTEEEMVVAAIRAGEEAAENDFKLKYEACAEELVEVRRELEELKSSAENATNATAEAQNRVARIQADWENYRRRTAQERIAERARACEKLVESLLPVIDDMERAIDHAQASELSGEFEQFVNGVDAVHTKMLNVLAKEGVEVINPRDGAFNPLEHQAVGRVEDPEAFDETVRDVYQKGYRMGDHIVRSAMVTVTYGGPVRPAEEPVSTDDGAVEEANQSSEDTCTE